MAFFIASWGGRSVFPQCQLPCCPSERATEVRLGNTRGGIVFDVEVANRGGHLIATREEKKKKEGRNTISEIQSIAKRDASSDAVIGGVKIHADDTDDTNARKYVKEALSKSPR